MFNAGIVLSGDVCQLKLVRYGSPDLQMAFVSFVRLMLRVEDLQGELGGTREGPGFLCCPRGLPTCPQFKHERGLLPVQGALGNAGSVPVKPSCIYPN